MRVNMLLSTTYAAAIIIMVCFGSPAFAVERSGPILIKDVGEKMLIGADIAQPSDIEYIIIDGNRKITYRNNPDLVTEIYTALQNAFELPEQTPVMTGFPIILKLKNGKILRLLYYQEPPQLSNSSRTVFLSQRYRVPKLASVLEKVRHNANAAVLDSRIGELEVSRVEAQYPYLGKAEIPVDTDEGRALMCKAKAIVDCIDLRSVKAKSDPGDIPDAISKFGIVTLHLKNIINFDVFVWDHASLTPHNGFANDISIEQIECNKISIMDYGNYKPPLVLLQQARGGLSYLCFNLTRRALERADVETYGFPGRPLSDTEYYKNPNTLYKELHELTKSAVEKWKKTEQTFPPETLPNKLGR